MTRSCLLINKSNHLSIVWKAIETKEDAFSNTFVNLY